MLDRILSTIVFVAVTLLPAGCAFLGEHSSEDPLYHSKPWTYNKVYKMVWESSAVPQNLAELTGGKVTITGQCHVKGNLPTTFLKVKRTIMMPFLTAASDGSLAPSFKISLSAYETLDKSFRLAPAVESVQLYQRWVSSLEYACPEGLNRSISHCSLKKLYSVRNLWGDQPLYNFERLNQWLSQNQDNHLLLIPDFSLLSSRAALNLKYSSGSDPVVNQPIPQKVASILPYLGRQSLDWVVLNDVQQLDASPMSSGRCSVIWQELEEIRRTHPDRLTIEQLDQVSQALIPVLMGFMKDALNQMNNASD